MLFKAVIKPVAANRTIATRAKISIGTNPSKIFQRAKRNNIPSDLIEIIMRVYRLPVLIAPMSSGDDAKKYIINCYILSTKENS